VLTTIGIPVIDVTEVPPSPPAVTEVPFGVITGIPPVPPA
jgi:hypothetical protein